MCPFYQINLILDKELRSHGPFVQGDEVTFTLTPRNEGPMDALAGWSVTEVLPDSLTRVSMSGDGYSCSGDTCTAGYQLAAGSAGNDITVKATINDKAAIDQLTARLDRQNTTPMDALAYRFDIVLRGRRSTMFENKLEGN